MHRSLKRPALWIGLALIPILGLTGGGEAVHLLSTQASLQPSPGSGPPSGLLTAGTPVTVVERQGDWLKVRVEGWIPVSALPALHAEAAGVPPMTGETAEEAPSAAGAAAAGVAAAGATAAGSDTSVPAPDTGADTASTGSTPAATTGSMAAAPGTVVRVEGVISAGSRRMRKITGAGSEVILVPGSDLGAGDPEADARAQQRLQEIDAEAEKLKKEADRAMQGDSFASDSFTDATAKYNKIMAQQRRVLAERADVLAALHGRHEAEARKRSQASTIADERGFYTFTSLPPGTYTIYARLTQKDTDVEWVETVTVASETVRLDLNPENGRGFLKKK